MRRRTLSLSRPRTHVLAWPLQCTQDFVLACGTRYCLRVPQPVTLESRRSGCMLLHGSPDVPYSPESPRRSMWNNYHSAGTMYDTFSHSCNSLLYDMQGESLMSGTWVGLDSFSAAGRDARTQLILLTLRCTMCTGIRLLPNFVPLSPHFSAMCESSSFYFKSLSRCQAPYVNSKFCVRLTHNRHRKKGFNSTCERVTVACNSVARF